MATAPLLPRLKVVVLGDAGVGKSSLIRALQAAAEGTHAGGLHGGPPGGGDDGSISIADVVLADVGVRAQLWECSPASPEHRATPVLEGALVAILG